MELHGAFLRKGTEVGKVNNCRALGVYKLYLLSSETWNIAVTRRMSPFKYLFRNDQIIISVSKEKYLLLLED